MKPSRLTVFASALAGLFCIANTASAQLAFDPLTKGASKDARTEAHRPSDNFPSKLKAVSLDTAHFLSLIIGGVGMLHLLRRRTRARLI